MKKFLRWVWSFLEVVIIIYVIALTLFVLCKNKYGYTQFGDYSFVTVGLMEEKTIQDVSKGDLLLVKNSNDIHKGDLIYYYSVINDEYIVKSGIVSDVIDDNYNSLYTVGTGTNAVSIAGSRLLGKYSTTYSNMGSIISVLESRIGFLFLVLLPIMIVFIYQLYEFVVILKYNEVSDDDSNKSKKKIVTKDTKKTDSVETHKKEKVDEEKNNDIEVL